MQASAEIENPGQNESFDPQQPCLQHKRFADISQTERKEQSGIQPLFRSPSKSAPAVQDQQGDDKPDDRFGKVEVKRPIVDQTAPRIITADFVAEEKL